MNWESAFTQSYGINVLRRVNVFRGKEKGRCDIEPSWRIEIRVSVRSEERRSLSLRSLGFLSRSRERRRKEGKRGKRNGWKRLSHEREGREGERGRARGIQSERSGKLRTVEARTTFTFTFLDGFARRELQYKTRRPTTLVRVCKRGFILQAK